MYQSSALAKAASDQPCRQDRMVMIPMTLAVLEESLALSHSNFSVHFCSSGDVLNLVNLLSLCSLLSPS